MKPKSQHADAAVPRPETAAPNVVLILADDLGYSDVGCFGGEIDTPNIDALAADGVRMSQFYVNPRCSPTRASLLTGRYAHEVGIGVLTTDDRPFGYRGDLAQDRPTIAELLGSHGYRTCIAGKWHLSSDPRTPSPSWPTRRGFQSVFGILRGATSYFQPKTLVRGERDAEHEAFADDFYLTDALGDHAVEFVRSAAAKPQPFFLYLPFTAPHWPLHAPEIDILRYRGVYDAGWDATRRRRYDRMRELGLIDTATSLSEPDSPAVPWNDEVIDTGWEARRMEVYAAQVSAMDRAIGRVLQAVRETGQERDTLVLFLSDNGACAEEIPPAEDGALVLKPDTCPPRDRAGRPVQAGNIPGVSPGPESTYASYGQRWANVSNTPFRLYKRWVHEGGIAAPLVVRWPAGGVTGGRLDHTPAHVIDILPTVLAAVADPDAGPQWGQRGGLDGTDLAPGWRDVNPGIGEAAETAPPGERPLCWEHTGNAAVRRGRWKLVREADGPWELYDLQDDRAETQNLAAALPDLVEELAEVWEHWAERVGVIPWPEIVQGYVRQGKSPAQAGG